MTANLKGPLPTKNNLTGTQEVRIALTGSTAVTYTHGNAANPLKVEVFLDGIPVESTTVAVTMPSVNAITLTPNGVGADEYTCLITWALPSEIVDGVPTVNFV